MSVHSLNGIDPGLKSRKILITVDDTEAGVRMLTWALKKLILPNDFVSIMYVGHDPALSSVRGWSLHIPSDDWARIISEHNEHEQELLNKYALLLDGANIPHEKVLRRGDPREVILETSESKKVDMIVMGSRQLNAVKRMFIGSVSSYVVQHSAVPVVVFRQ